MMFLGVIGHGEMDAIANFVAKTLPHKFIVIASKFPYFVVQKFQLLQQFGQLLTVLASVELMSSYIVGHD